MKVGNIKRVVLKKFLIKPSSLLRQMQKNLETYASKVIGTGGGGFMIIYAEKNFRMLSERN